MFFFTKFAQTIIDNKISTTDLVILLKVLEYVSYGNVINLTQQTIADDLDIARQQVNRTFKKLEDSGIFFKEKKSLFVNPNYLCMGDLNKATDTKAYQIALSHAYNELKDVIPEKADLDKKAHESMSFMKK
ncbi:hypothetical protein A8E62_32140 [Burkholderia cenocepacia]|uniref:Plasmid replication protein RepL domain-containing protein n=1 Tax=Burkholderia cenocepacia TaxID=95486 RepID=A0A1V2VV42_9BURK|nr:hypothetical protein A8E62_32140 [Burkholderia cenocepacia]ONU51202.1 hypothetical protein A8E67_35685 [Burkholderia cenocepacia]ONU66265.1 hypothetical protein A8E68_07265 [Burkholderia cenocepacia]ONU76313.1 hypothetical protein A8E72_33930 [Burkholderia cenocepacia]ONU79520.1 hypothetical protein A8E73_22235 [Burkholderia cenocepacia]